VWSRGSGWGKRWKRLWPKTRVLPQPLIWKMTIQTRHQSPTNASATSWQTSLSCASKTTWWWCQTWSHDPSHHSHRPGLLRPSLRRRLTRARQQQLQCLNQSLSQSSMKMANQLSHHQRPTQQGISLNISSHQFKLSLMLMKSGTLCPKFLSEAGRLTQQWWRPFSSAGLAWSGFTLSTCGILVWVRQPCTPLRLSYHSVPTSKM